MLGIVNIYTVCLCTDLSSLLSQLSVLPLSEIGGRKGEGGGGTGRERVYVCLPLCVTGRTGLINFF